MPDIQEQRAAAKKRAEARIRAQNSIILQEKDQVTQSGALGRGLSQGLTFGFGDEIAANLSGAKAFLTEPGDSIFDSIKGFREAKELSSLESRANLFDDRENFPKTSFTGELAGGAISGGATFSALNKATNLSKLPLALRVPGIGAAEGALFGAGTAEPGERVQGALFGAGVGAIATPLLAGGGVALMSGLRPAAQRLGESLFGTPRDNAIKQIIRAMDADDITVDEAQILMRNMGPNSVLADLGDTLTRQGRTVTSELGSAASSTKRFLDARQRVGQINLRQAARRATGSNDFDRGIIEIVNGAESKAKPLYDEVFSQVLDVSPPMLEMLKRPAMVSARKKAAGLLRNEGFSEGIVDDVTDVRYMDAIKRALSDSEGSAIRSGNSNQARVLGQLRRDFVAEIDAQVPKYAEARSIFAGEQAMRDAADFGRTIFSGKKDPADIGEQISAMGESELTAARMGFLRWLSGELANQSVNSNRIANKFTDVPRFRRNLQQLFPSQDAVDDFIQTASAQSTFGRTRNTVTGGSHTARIDADREALSPGLLSTVASSAFDPASGLRNIARLVNSSTRLTPEVLEEMGSILFNPKIIPSQALRRNVLPQLFEIPRAQTPTTAGIAGGLVGSQQGTVLDDLRRRGLLGTDQ